MEQLTKIITRLRNLLADKEIVIEDSAAADADEYDRLDSCKRKIDALEERIKYTIAAAERQGPEAVIQPGPVTADFEQAAREIENAIDRI